MHRLPKVFMIGWEFPPHNSGGLGTACQGLTTALSQEQISQIFVLPKELPINAPFIEVAYPQTPYFKQVHVNLRMYPYGSITEEQELYLQRRYGSVAHSMVDEAYEYAEIVRTIAGEYPHDLIHAHDWMTYPAALAAHEVSSKPTIMHVHSTEYDRTLNGFVNPDIAKIEYECLSQADQIIAVSDYTRGVVSERYGISRNKIAVIHNGVDLKLHRQHSITDEEITAFANGKKIVIFVGRLTGQKGPDYFVKVASGIAAHIPEALFVIAGNGDMYEQIIIQSAGHGLTGKLLFSGFLRNKQRELLYRRADLFIMPSVSEPFGIVALEAAAAKTPVIISRQSGVKEVLRHALTSNYWDTDTIVDQAVAVLKYPALSEQLALYCAQEIEEITWRKAAKKCVGIYQSMFH